MHYLNVVLKLIKFHFHKYLGRAFVQQWTELVDSVKSQNISYECFSRMIIGGNRLRRKTTVLIYDKSFDNSCQNRKVQPAVRSRYSVVMYVEIRRDGCTPGQISIPD